MEFQPPTPLSMDGWQVIFSHKMAAQRLSSGLDLPKDITDYIAGKRALQEREKKSYSLLPERCCAVTNSFSTISSPKEVQRLQIKPSVKTCDC